MKVITPQTRPITSSKPSISSYYKDDGGGGIHLSNTALFLIFIQVVIIALIISINRDAIIKAFGGVNSSAGRTASYIFYGDVSRKRRENIGWIIGISIGGVVVAMIAWAVYHNGLSIEKVITATKDELNQLKSTRVPQTDPETESQSSEDDNDEE